MARLIVFILFGGFGVFMLVVGVTQYLQQRRQLASAEPIDAVIVHSAVHSSESRPPASGARRPIGTATHRADVRFRYELRGVEYESDLMGPSAIVRGYASPEGAAEELRPFPLGATVQAFVDPAHPDKAFLLREASSGPLVFMIIGVLLPPVAWFASRLV